MEVAASWAQVVRSVLQAQEELAKGAVSPFALLCAADAKLRAHLDLICDLSFHGLLVAWVMEGVRERILDRGGYPPAFEHNLQVPVCLSVCLSVLRYNLQAHAWAVN